MRLSFNQSIRCHDLANLKTVIGGLPATIFISHSSLSSEI